MSETTANGGVQPEDSDLDLTVADAELPEVEPGQPVRIRVHPGLCVGWGNCHRWAPDVYPLDEQGQVAFHVLEVPAEHAQEARWGAMACPAHAISYQGAATRTP